MNLQVKRKNYPVSSFAAASQIYSELRDKSGQGASKFPYGSISNQSDIIAHISYNGKVWAGADTLALDKEILFTPYN